MAAPSSFSPAAMVAKIRGERTASLELVTGNDTSGRAIFVFVAVRANLVEHFRQKLTNQNIDLSKEGTVLFTGWGTPTESDKTRALAEFKKMSA